MELSKKKQKTNKIILTNAIDLLLEKSIHTITIKDISLKANIGEATIYRNFLTKENLIIQAAIELSSSLATNYFKINKNDNGFNQLVSFYDSFVKIFKEHKEYYRFLGELDYFIQEKNQIDTSEYEMNIDSYYEVFINIYNKGLHDGSIKEVEDIDSVYYSTVVGINSFAKKLANNDLVKKDSLMDKVKQLDTLKQITLNYFRR